MYLEIRNGAHFSCDVFLNFLLSFQMKNFETNKTTKKIKKVKADIKRQLEKSIMSDKNVITDIEEQQ